MVRVRSIKDRALKTEPTMRQRTESYAKQDGIRKKRARRVATRMGWPLQLLKRIFDNRVGKFLGRILGLANRFLVPSYFRNSWLELKLVTWPSRRETWRLVGAVFIFTIIFGSLVAVSDKILDEIFRRVVLR